MLIITEITSQQKGNTTGTRRGSNQGVFIKLICINHVFIVLSEPPNKNLKGEHFEGIRFDVFSQIERERESV